MSDAPELLDVVRLVADLPEEGLRAGIAGTVVEIFEQPTVAYEVEFTDDDGRTVAQVALRPEQIELVAADGTG
jgi:hypothetical protein